MKTPTTAGALRVARALLGYSQRDVANETGLNQRALWYAEQPTNGRFDLNLTLVAYYRDKGIEFVGEPNFGEPVFRSGARWKSTSQPDDVVLHRQEDPRSTHTGISFVAARALLNLLQQDVGEKVGLKKYTVAALEKSVAWDEGHELLRAFYDEQNVEFLGWGKPGTNQFFGVGVCWKGFEPTP